MSSRGVEPKYLSKVSGMTLGNSRRPISMPASVTTMTMTHATSARAKRIIGRILAAGMASGRRVPRARLGDLDRVVLDHEIGEQLAAHRLDLGPRRGGIALVE